MGCDVEGAACVARRLLAFRFQRSGAAVPPQSASALGRIFHAGEGWLAVTLQRGVVPLGEEGEVLPFITGAAGAGGFIGEHLLLLVALAQVDHRGGQLGIVIEVGRESDVLAALVVDRCRHHQLAAADLQFGDPQQVVILHTLAQILPLPAVVATLDPAALHGALGLELFGRERSNRLGVEGRQFVIKGGQSGILADQGFDRPGGFGAVKGGGCGAGQQRGKQQGGKQGLVHR